MARITVEDCLKKVNNRFTLIHMAANRVRQLRKGAEPKIVSKNKDIVISLREIAAGNVVEGEKIDQNHLIETGPEILTDVINEEIEVSPPEDEEKEEEQASEGN